MTNENTQEIIKNQVHDFLRKCQLIFNLLKTEINLTNEIYLF